MRRRVGIPEHELGVAGDHRHNLVALVIMAVTLLGAVAVVLETHAGEQEAVADREARRQGLDALEGTIESNRRSLRIGIAFDLLEQEARSLALIEASAGTTSPDPYAAAHLEAHRRTRAFLVTYRARAAGGNADPGGDLDVVRFDRDRDRPALRASQLQEAYAAQRDQWSRKGTRYLRVITLFAVALFLLGLSLTVARRAAWLFVAVGCTLACAASYTALTAYFENVASARTDAIDAYVRAELTLRFPRVDGEGIPLRSEYQAAIVDLGEALRSSDRYTDAYLARGNAHFRLDQSRPEGPKGSHPALADWSRAADLDPLNAVAWTNVGAAYFWLGEYEASAEAHERSFRLDPRSPTANVNRAQIMLISGREDEYPAQLRRIEDILTRLPDWEREGLIERFLASIDRAIRYRPEVGSKFRVLGADLIRANRKIASLRLSRTAQ